MTNPDLIRSIENRFAKEAKERRGQIPEGYKPLNLNQLINQEGRLVLAALSTLLDKQNNEQEKEVIKSIIKKISDYQEKKGEPQFTTKELEILLGTQDGEKKGVYQRIEEARRIAYEILSKEFQPERLTQLANVNDNFAEFLRGIGILGPNNELLVNKDGLRDNLARIFSIMFIEDPKGFEDLKQKIEEYNNLSRNINDIGNKIAQIVETNLRELLGERLEGLSDRENFMNSVRKISFDVIAEAIESGEINEENINIEDIINRISQKIENEMLERGVKQLGRGPLETWFIFPKKLVREGRFRESMRKISEELKEKLKKGVTDKQIEEIKTSLNDMRESLTQISNILYKTFLEHGNEFVSRAILKGPQEAIKEIGERGVGNVADHFREVNKAIDELNKIHSSQENNEETKKQEAKGVLANLRKLAQQLLPYFITPELEYLIKQSQQNS